MDFDTYKNLVDILENNYKRDKENLAIKFATSNNPNQIGGIVTDDLGSIIIESISPDISFGQYKPSCIYFGSILGRDLKPNKNGNKRRIRQTDIR